MTTTSPNQMHLFEIPVFTRPKPPAPKKSPLRDIVADLCKKNGHVRNRDIQQASGATERCVHNLLDRMCKEGSLFKKPAGVGSKLVFFTSKEARDAYIPPPAPVPPSKRVRPSRAKPKELHKKPGRPVGAKDSKPRKGLQDIGKATPGFSRVRGKAINVMPPRAPRAEWSGEVIGLDKPPTICPVGYDFRFTVHELPQGYRSQINPQEARPWTRYVEARA